MTYEFGSKEIVKGSGYISRQYWKKRRTIFINNHIGVRPCVQLRVYSPVGGSPIK